LLSIAWIFTFPAVNAVAVSNISHQRRRLQKPVNSGVSARCRQMMGACHGIEILLPAICPDIARSTAGDIADFAITSGSFKQAS
jgi:hypothetical protein